MKIKLERQNPDSIPHIRLAFVSLLFTSTFISYMVSICIIFDLYPCSIFSICGYQFFLTELYPYSLASGCDYGKCHIRFVSDPFVPLWKDIWSGPIMGSYSPQTLVSSRTFGPNVVAKWIGVGYKLELGQISVWIWIK